MTLGALSHTVEARTFAAQARVVEGTLTIDRMPRLEVAITNALGPAIAKAQCDRDEEGRYIMSLSVTMPIEVSCQRCLAPVQQELQSETDLAVIWADDQAEHLPSRYDPLIAGEETDLWQVVEDELLLALPPFCYHEDPSCSARTAIGPMPNAPELSKEPAQERDNPFGVLASLRDDLEKGS